LLALESEFDIILNIAGSAEIPWDKVEIQHIAREHVEVHDHPEETSEAKTQEASESTVDEKVPANGEKPAKKKSRRRPRHKRRKPVKTATEDSSAENIMPAVAAEPSAEDSSFLRITEKAQQDENNFAENKEAQEDKATSKEADDTSKDS
jgi:ribonuclease E